MSFPLLPTLLLLAGLVFLSVFLLGQALLSKQSTHLEVERLKARIGLRNTYQQEVVKQRRCGWCALGRVLGPTNEKELEKTRQLLIRAGYRSDEALGGYFFIKTVVILLGVLLGLFAWLWFAVPPPFAILIPVILMLVPEKVLSYLGDRRLDKINAALPDFLDMTNICMNAGLSYLVAIRRVTDELKDVFPEICYEFDYLLDQIQMGVPRVEALKQFAERNPTEDIQQLIQVLIQNEKLGTPIGQAINEFTKRLYLEREQRLEEKAAKTSAKMAIVILPFLMLPYFILMLGEKLVMLGRNW